MDRWTMIYICSRKPKQNESGWKFSVKILDYYKDEAWNKGILFILFYVHRNLLSMVSSWQ